MSSSAHRPPPLAIRLQQCLQAGLERHRQGDPTGAAHWYREALKLDASAADANHLLGVVALEQGRLDEAEALFRRAIARQPGAPWYHQNLGLCLRRLGRPAAAEAAFLTALARQPDFVDARYQLGLSLQEQGRFEEALAAFQLAVEQAPQFRDGWLARGRLLERLVRFPLAAEAYQHALACPAADAEAPLALALLRVRQRQPEQAEALYRAVLAREPAQPAALNNLGELLRRRGQLDEAVALLRRAVAARPQAANYLVNLATALLAAGDAEAATAAARQALALDACHAGALNVLGSAGERAGRLVEAAAHFRSAVVIDPTLAAAWNNLGGVLRDLGEAAAARDAYAEAQALAPADPAVASNALLGRLYGEHESRASLAAAHRQFAAAHTAFRAPTLARPATPPPPTVLRVGLLSPDLREHSVACFLESLLAARDPARVAYVAFSLAEREDATSQRLRAHCAAWLPCAGLEGEALAERIAGESVDVLIDLAGHTAHNALTALAYRPAPVIVGYLGYPETSGLDVVDFRLSDAVVDPPGEADACSAETLLRLPASYFCYTPPADLPPVAARERQAIDGICFGSFNNSAKLNPSVVALWARVLRAVAPSRLLLKARGFADPEARAALTATFAAHGVAADRLSFADYAPTRAAHLAYYAGVDIALDSFPYNGATTTCEALVMGVPVVSLCGERHNARVGASLLAAAGRPQWVAASADAFVARCVALASGDLAGERRRLHAELPASALCDAPAFARAFEALLFDAWRRVAERPLAPSPAGDRVIAFSLWGGDPRYTVGAVKNALLARRYFPEWRCRFYIDATVPPGIVARLQAMTNVDLVVRAERADFRATLWRFAAAADPAVEVAIFRDTDSRLGPRERAAVDAWLAAGKAFHLMRDHAAHAVPMMAGMWGVRGGALADFDALRAAFLEGFPAAAATFDSDQRFLAEVVFPRAARDATIHDRFAATRDAALAPAGVPFPTPLAGDWYVGKVFLADDSTPEGLN